MSFWLGLDGAVVAVTGAGGGIGRAVASAFAQAGARVALLDIQEEPVTRAALCMGGLGLVCDVTDDASVASATETVADRLGPCDILVNNAAFLRPGALEEMALEDWQSMLDVNLTGYLRCARAFGAGMLERGRGSVVHVGSISGSNVQGNSGAYSPGKAAVSMLSRQLAFEWGPRGVRSNVVSPGLVRTPLSERFYADADTRTRREQVVPLRRIGDVSDIADAVLWFASPRASYVTGQEVVVDGGFSQTLMSHIPRPGYAED